jgi:hypothetical protein
MTEPVTKEATFNIVVKRVAVEPHQESKAESSFNIQGNAQIGSCQCEHCRNQRGE